MNSMKEAMTSILGGASEAITYFQEYMGELWEHLQEVATSSWTSCHHYLGVLGEHLEPVFTVPREDQAMKVVDLAEGVQTTMIDNENLDELTEDITALEPKLRRETFENSIMMGQAKERRFLLVFILIAQTMVILLMLGLLVFLSGAAPASPPPAALVSVDYLRLATDLLAGTLPLLLLWLLSRSGQSWQGVERYPWGQESLLREDQGQGLWFFGPQGASTLTSPLPTMVTNTDLSSQEEVAPHYQLTAANMIDMEKPVFAFCCCGHPEFAHSFYYHMIAAERYPGYDRYKKVKRPVEEKTEDLKKMMTSKEAKVV